MQKAFTLIELLIVIAIIGILSVALLPTITSGPARARDAQRITDIKKISEAVALYNADHGRYPLGSRGSNQWSGHCPNYGDNDTYIIGLEDYLAPLPQDPRYDDAGRCYLYRSNGTDYSILAHLTMETVCDGSDADNISDPGDECNPPNIRALDRPCGNSPQGCEQATISISSQGARNW